MLDKLATHIPKAVKDSNANINKLLSILEGMLAEKNKDVIKYERVFDPTTASSIEWVRKYVDSFKGEYLLETERSILEKIYELKNDTYSKKGVKKAIAAVLDVYLAQYNNHITDYSGNSSFIPILTFTSLQLGVLPNGQDIADEFDAAFFPKKEVPKLLGNKWSDYYHQAEFEVDSSLDAYVEDFLRVVVKRLAPMIEKEENILFTSW
jgi:hypothetical protein